MLFSLVIDFVMRRTTKEKKQGIKWKGNTKLADLDFADDIALIETKLEELQDLTNKLVTEAESVGLRLNHKKCKAMGIGNIGMGELILEEKVIEFVNEFTYLGSILASTGKVDEDIRCRIGKAIGVFRKMNDIWTSKKITLRIKLQLFNAIIVPMMLYGSETWKESKGNLKKVDVFQQRCLRKILGITYRDRTTNVEIMKRTSQEPLSIKWKERRLRMAGHVLRMDTYRNAHISMTWSPEGGKRKRGRPAQTWRTLKEDLKTMGIGENNAVQVAGDRLKWRKLTALCATSTGKTKV